MFYLLDGLRGTLPSVISQVQGLVDCEAGVSKSDVTLVLDQYSLCLRAVSSRLDASQAETLKTWQNMGERIGLLRKALTAPDCGGAYYWKEGLRVGLGLCFLFPKDQEPLEDFLFRLASSVDRNVPELSQDPHLTSHNMQRLRDASTDHYDLFQDGDSFFKVMPRAWEFILKQKAFAYYLMREMMFQGAVTLMRESETVPLWPIEALVEVDGQTALKMRYCPSGDYEMGIFKNMSASDLEEMEAMIGCLAYWHSRGWAHLDVKPGNFLRTSQGPKLIDCGLSVHHLATKVSHYGTPIYFYKNTLVANRDPWRRDVHAMALSLCELIFKPGIISPTMDYAAYFKPLLTGLPQPLQRVLTRALSDTFEEKHPNAGDLLEDFRQARKEMLDLNKAQESLVGLP